MPTDDDDRDAILRRRARFVAVALGGLVTTGAACAPEPCLRYAPPLDETGGSEDPAGPQPCLEVVSPPEDDDPDRDDGDAPPQVCLEAPYDPDDEA
jgi:hypothetical protein